MKLQSFLRVNEQAVDRIYRKIENRCAPPTKLHQMYKSRWMELKVHFQENLWKLNRNLESILAGAFCARCETLASVNPIISEPTSGQLVPFAKEILALECAIRNDEPSILATSLALYQVNDALASNSEAILDYLLELSIIHHAGGSIQYLLSKAFPANGLMADHNLLNRMITRVGEENLFHDRLEQIQNRQSLCEICRGGTRESTVGLAVDLVGRGQKNIILAVDELGRLPLHYSALCGLDTVCQKILDHVQDQGQASSLILSLDAHGYTPFHYAVAENHMAVAKIFLNTLEVEGQLSGQPGFKIMGHMQSLLNVAIRYQFDDIVVLLGKSRLFFPWGLAHEESPIYVAAEIGRDDYLEILLEVDNKTNIDDPQLPCGWSALTIACIKGHRKAAELLLQAGASQHIPDYRGWYAIEHAALRGHFSLAELLKSWDKSQMTGDPAMMPLRPVHHAGLGVSVTSDHAIVNIGDLQNGKQGKGVDLRNSSSKDKILTGVLPPLDMSVSVGSTVSQLIHLPIMSNMVNEPFIFPMHNSNEAHLVFKFYRQGSSCGKGDLIGSAATLLRSEEDYFGPNRESLFRGRTIPILAKETSEFLGTVTFTFLIAKQPMDPKTSPPIDNYFPEQETQLVGHRGNETGRCML